MTINHRLLLVPLLVAVLAVGVAIGAGLERSSHSGTTRGSGRAATQTRSVAAFDSVELAGSTVVTVHVGTSRSVVVHSDDNLVDRIRTRVRDGRLVITTAGSFKTNLPMRVDVGAPSLRSLELSGSGVVSASGIRAASFAVTVPGSGVVRADGSVQRLRVVLDGSGDVQLGALSADDVTAAVGGSGRIVVAPSKSLSASVEGSGVVVYTGSPARVTTNVTGSGAVVHG